MNRIILFGSGLAAAALLPLSDVHAKTSLRVLYSFCPKGTIGDDCKDGFGPKSTVVKDSSGNLYGTVGSGGGTAKDCPDEGGCGAVWKLAPDGTYTVQHAFTAGNDGAFPGMGLTRDKKTGDLYGVANIGGNYNCDPAQGCGLVFKIAPDGTFSVVYTFEDDSKTGAYPKALLLERKGAFYSTYEGSPSSDPGGIFKVTPDGKEKLIHHFSGGSGPNNASGAGVVIDSSGNFYGTTIAGGTGKCGGGCGTVYEVTADGTEKVLHSFKGGANDGQLPMGGVVMDSAGNLYGTTSQGGSSTGDGPGVIFKVASDGTYSLLYKFGTQRNDGTSPYQSGLIQDGTGNMYGVTTFGGSGQAGTIYQITPDGVETVLHSFPAYPWPKGSQPIVEHLFMDGKGSLYGTTLTGGNGNCGDYDYGFCGVVFKLRR